jgi:UDP-N-acetylglucosamine transferase subunit ALG13
LIFVTVGSQKFQFNRLLQHIDDLIDRKVIQEEVFAQTGFSNYQPKNYSCQDFLDSNEFAQKVKDSRIVITHGGTGSIMGAVKEGKKVIAVPRLSRYGEHVDDHQEQIVKQLIEEHIIIGVNRLEEMEYGLKKADAFSVLPYVSNSQAMIDSIDAYIIRVSKLKNNS